jgi:uncharacterized protein
MPTMTLARTLATLALLAVIGAGHAQEPPQRGLPIVKLQAGMHAIRAQVAASPQERATGLMHRSEMPTNEGMLFVFEQPSVQCFWMKNTLLPLSIAFIADDGTVVNLRDMQPGDVTGQHCSAKPVRFALEMNQGWFAKRGVKSGTRLDGSPFAAR